MNYKALGMRVRMRRKEMRLTQGKLAEMSDISLSFLGHVERGSRKASLETIVSLCNALQISPTKLLQDSLDEEAQSEGYASRKDLVQEISLSVLENIKKWGDTQ